MPARFDNRTRGKDRRRERGILLIGSGTSAVKQSWPERTVCFQRRGGEAGWLINLPNCFISTFVHWAHLSHLSFFPHTLRRMFAFWKCRCNSKEINCSPAPVSTIGRVYRELANSLVPVRFMHIGFTVCTAVAAEWGRQRRTLPQCFLLYIFQLCLLCPDGKHSKPLNEDVHAVEPKSKRSSFLALQHALLLVQINFH